MKKVFLYTAHKKLWDMLAEDSLLSKGAVIDYLFENGTISLREAMEVNEHHNCFACLYSNENCYECPLYFKHGDGFLCLNGLYLKWKKSVSLYKKICTRYFDYSDNVISRFEKMAQLYAKRIRDLPVREGIEWR